MFHMLQTLEREPQEDFTNQIFDASPASSRLPFVSHVAPPTFVVFVDLYLALMSDVIKTVSGGSHHSINPPSARLRLTQVSEFLIK